MPTQKPPAIAKIVSAVIIVLVFAVVAVMLFWGSQDPRIEIFSDGIRIEAQFGETIPFSSITGITLREESMTQIGLGKRTFGYGGVGQTNKGQFESETLGKMLLYVQANTAPTIEMKRKNGERTVFISLRDGEATRMLFEQLAAAFAAR